MSIWRRTCARSALVLGVGAGVLAVLPAPAEAVGDVVVSQLTTSGSGCYADQPHVGQSFVAPATGTITSFGLGLYADTPTQRTFRIVSRANGSVLYSTDATISGDGRGALTVFRVPSSTRVEVEAGKTYGVEMVGGGCPVGVYYQDDNSSYGPGNFYVPGNVGDFDLVFSATVSDDVSPTVTINQASDQPDPSRPSNGAIRFTAVFSEPVSGFTGSDVEVSGTAADAFVVSSSTTDSKTFSLSVTGASRDGSVTVRIPAGVASDLQANANVASTSTRNTVQYLAQQQQTVAFTSTAPTGKQPGSPSYTPTVSKGGSTNAVVYGTTTSNVCTVASATGETTFQHAGTCTITADQAGNQDYTAAQQATQDVVVGKLPQTVAFTSSSPGLVNVRDAAYAATATGGPSGSPVAVTAVPSTVCTSVSTGDGSATVSFVGPGTCAVLANQAGSGDYEAATQVMQQIQVQKVRTEAFVSGQGQQLVSGQPFALSGSVSSADGVAVGTAQFYQDGRPVGPPVPVTSPGRVAGPTTSATSGSHRFTLAFAPADGVRYDGGTGVAAIFQVDKAASTTSVAVSPDLLVATVAAVSPGRADPSGTVQFLVDGQAVGTAPVSGGRAQLVYTTPAGSTRVVSAVYSGDTEFQGSRSDARRGDPTITASVASNAALSAFGWYRARPTVSFNCTSPDGVRLSALCPEPASVTTEGLTRVTRTITTTDGGSATVSVPVLLDESDPKARLKGLGRGKPRCVGSDDVSGVAVCNVKRVRREDGLVRFTAVVRDRAGNADRVSRIVRR